MIGLMKPTGIYFSRVINHGQFTPLNIREQLCFNISYPFLHSIYSSSGCVVLSNYIRLCAHILVSFRYFNGFISTICIDYVSNEFLNIHCFLNFTLISVKAET